MMEILRKNTASTLGSDAPVILREFKLEDFAGIRSWVNNPEVTAKLVDAKVFEVYHDETMTQGFLTHSINQNDPTMERMVIADQLSDEYLGQIEIFKIDKKLKSCSFDVVLKSPKLFDIGIGTRVCEKLKNYIFYRLKLDHIYLSVVANNLRALACFKNCGFKTQQKKYPGGCLMETEDIITLVLDQE
jgi:RimJ/RimL family protein N-acetyltransferase